MCIHFIIKEMVKWLILMIDHVYFHCHDISSKNGIPGSESHGGFADEGLAFTECDLEGDLQHT